MDWQPHITVATIVEDNGRFLMVEELKPDAWCSTSPPATSTRTKP
jgi:hypothetical protein